MGLDMYLYAEKYISGWDEKDKYNRQNVITAAGLVEDDIAEGLGLYVKATVAYWRKAYHIHSWFVSKVQDDNDNCGEYEVSTQTLEELLMACNKVLKAHADNDREFLVEVVNEEFQDIEDDYISDEDIDEWFIGGTIRTVEMLSKILNNERLDKVSFYYKSSW